MSNKTDNNIEKVLREIKDIKRILESLVTDNNINKENINQMLVKVSDLSCKVDLDISTLNITSKTVGKVEGSGTTSVAPKAQNVMAYFKAKYLLDPEAFIGTVITQADVDKVFLEHEDTLNTKSKSKTKDALPKEQAALIYKCLIQKDDSRKKKIKAMKEAEDNKNTEVLSEMKESTSSKKPVEKNKKTDKGKKKVDSSSEEDNESIDSDNE
jgi:hypothetical protein